MSVLRRGFPGARRRLPSALLGRPCSPRGNPVLPTSGMHQPGLRGRHILSSRRTRTTATRPWVTTMSPPPPPQSRSTTTLPLPSAGGGGAGVWQAGGSRPQPVRHGEGEDRTNDFDAVAPLGLLLCFDLLTAGDDQLEFGLATGGRAACPWVRGSGGGGGWVGEDLNAVNHARAGRTLCRYCSAAWSGRAPRPRPSRGVPWSEWLMNKLGIKLSMTSDSHRADESVVASAYTSKNHSKRRTRM